MAVRAAHICLFGKLPPIVGGVSGLTFSTILELRSIGYKVAAFSDASRYPILLKSHVGGRAEIAESHDITPIDLLTSVATESGYAESMADAAIKILGTSSIDCVIGWYLQPYGRVASIVAEYYNKPFALIHAGSDIFNSSLELSKGFSDCIARASGVFTVDYPDVITQLSRLKVKSEQIRLIGSGTRLPEYFGRTGRSVEDLTEVARASLRNTELFDRHIRDGFLRLGCQRAHASTLCLCVGKASPGKHFHVVAHAAAKLRSEGFDIQIVFIVGGSEQGVAGLLTFIESIEGGADACICLPFAAREYVAEMMNAVDIGLSLESGFAVGGHLSRIGYEMMRSGMATIVSPELAMKPFYRDIVLDGINALVVSPSVDEVSAALRGLLNDRDQMRQYGKMAKSTAHMIEAEMPPVGGVTQAVDRWISECVSTR